MNFIIELFESKKRNVICTIIDKLTRKRYYIACIANDKDIFVEITTNIFLQYNIFKYYNLFIFIMFNQDS